VGKPKQISKNDLVLAAKQQLIRRGASSVTLKNVAQAMGVTQGVVYYHFKTKDQLLTALLKEYTDQLHAEGTIERSTNGKDHQAAVLDFFAEEGYKAQISSDEHQLFYNLVAISLHHRELKQLLGESIEQRVNGLATQLGGDQQRARILLAMADGLALHALFDPVFSTMDHYANAKKFAENMDW
jgi:AcrR family transcriptional regulator